MSRKVAGNAMWNVGTQIVSLCVGLVALPLLLHKLGQARLGVFTLALGLIGFSGMFDLGLGRALTQTVSSVLGQGRSHAYVAGLVWRVLGLLACFGVFWMVALWVLAPFVVHRLLLLAGGMSHEMLFGLRVLALSIPFALVAVGAVGALEGLQQFRLLSIGRMPMSVLQFGLPVAVTFVVADVGWVIAALAFVRMVSMVLWTVQLHRLLPRASAAVVSRGDLSHALQFGGWLSVSNLVSPLLAYADRFYLSYVFPPATVAYYTVPFDTAFRATALPQTAMNALFPAFAQAQSKPYSLARMLDHAALSLVTLVLPAMLVAAVWAQPILQLWLNTDFAASSAAILRLLAFGIFLNSLAHLPYALLQAHGRADLTTKLHLLELPFFVLLLVISVHAFGIVGAALAWTLRVGIDAALLYAWAWHLYRPQRKALSRAVGLVVLAGGVFLLVVYAVRGWVQFLGMVVVGVACCIALLHEIRHALPLSKGRVR